MNSDLRLAFGTTLLLIVSPALSEGEPGTLWETTTTMQAGGMQMPGRTQQVCAPKAAEGPQTMASNDNRCEIYDVQKSAGHFSYKMKCPDGSGSGEMTYQGRDSYTSKMTMTAGGQTMNMETKAHRVGDCDASKLKKQVAAAQAQQKASFEQVCASTVSNVAPGMLDPAKGFSCDAKYKKQLCNKFSTAEGYSLVAARKSSGVPELDTDSLPQVAKFCAVDAEAVRARLCTEADKTQNLDFIAGNCPAIAQPLAQRECAGRGGTGWAPAEMYRTFCSTYAGKMARASKPGAPASGAQEPGAQPDASPEPPATPTAGDTIKEGAKKLKGLFGR